VAVRMAAEPVSDLLLFDHPLALVEGGARFLWRFGIDGLAFVLPADPATFVDDVDGDLRADRAGDRACRRKRPRKVIDDADPDRRVLGASELAAEAERGDGRRRIPQKRSARRYRFHGSSCELCDRWSPRGSVSSSIWTTLFEVNAPVTSGDRARTAPSKIGCTCVRRNPAAFFPQAAVRPPDMAPRSEAGRASADKSVEPAG